MHVLIVGGGGREHALAWRIARSPRVHRISTTVPNPGILALGGERCATDPVDWAVSHGVDLVVVGPEAPLVEGLVDRLEAAGIPAFGPTAAAARLEASKGFAKEFMDEVGIPTARWSSHDTAAGAHAAVDALGGACVVKADGLAAGKGVVVASTAAEAHRAVDEILGGRFGDAGARVVIEERLQGPELSVLALCDGRRALPLLPARDHKRRFDGGRGPNTGGMGAVCPPADVGADLVERVRRTVLQPAVDGMAARGTPFRGVLYAGLMLTPDGPKVLEFNVRFGDPECQPLMLMLDEDIVPLLVAAAAGDLPQRPLQWRPGVACCVVMVAGGYPGVYPRGMAVHGLPAGDQRDSHDLVVFHAGTREDMDGQVVTSGGRVLGVTAWGPDLAAARARAYEVVPTLRFDTAAWRTDIGLPGVQG
ncbi:MAG: phosphoribosylamine--glycine ligase [Deltaproteobacteria bacterium]|nr:MAG: phosphoribosylamine--glycine ligase [Deltaproteobacteria bacterium]